MLPTLGHGAYDFCCTVDSTFWTVIFYLLLGVLYYKAFRAVRVVSQADADDLTVATWLVAKRHPEFKAAIDDLSAQQPQPTAVPGHAAPGARPAPPVYPLQPTPNGLSPSTPNYPAQSAQNVGAEHPQQPDGRAAYGAAAPAGGEPRRTAFPAASLYVHCGDCSRNGFFVYRLPNGDVYSGEFKNGAADGMGTYYFSDGRRLTGMWANGRTF